MGGNYINFCGKGTSKSVSRFIIIFVALMKYRISSEYLPRMKVLIFTVYFHPAPYPYCFVFHTYFYLICMQAELFAKEAGREQPDIILFVMHEESGSICLTYAEHKERVAAKYWFVLQYTTL